MGSFINVPLFVINLSPFKLFNAKTVYRTVSVEHTYLNSSAKEIHLSHQKKKRKMEKE